MSAKARTQPCFDLHFRWILLREKDSLVVYIVLLTPGEHKDVPMIDMSTKVGSSIIDSTFAQD